MKILQVITSMDPRSGGPCQTIRNLAPSLSESGSVTEVVCLDDPQADYLFGETLKIHALGKGRGSWSFHPALRPWLDKNLPRFDAIILHGLWQYPGYALSQAAQRPSMPPYFVYPHGMLDPWFQRAPGRRLKAIRNWFYWKLIEQKIVRRAAALLFTCAEELLLARGTFRPYQPQREINAGFGITPSPAEHPDMAPALVEKCPGLNGRPFFLFLGRLHRKKGVDLLIQAYAKVYHAARHAQYSTFNSQPAPCLVIAGPGLETDYGQEMQKLAAELCPVDSVFWPGMLTGDAKWGALYQAEAFVLTSHQENFGIAVVESLACGTPVLISNQINIWREIKEDQAGLIDNDTTAGAEQLFRHWSHLPSAKKAVMKRAAKICYENRFGVAFAAQNLLATLKNLAVPLRASGLEESFTS